MEVRRVSKGLQIGGTLSQRPQSSQGASMWLFGGRHFRQRSKGLWNVGLEQQRDRKELRRGGNEPGGGGRSEGQRARGMRLAKAGSMTQGPRTWPFLSEKKSQGEAAAVTGCDRASDDGARFQRLWEKCRQQGDLPGCQVTQMVAVDAELFLGGSATSNTVTSHKNAVVCCV